MQTADPRWSFVMDGSVERLTADFLRDLNAGKYSFEEAKARYRALGDLLQQEYQPSQTPPALYNAIHARYRSIGDAIQRRYQRNYTAVSVDVVASRDMKSTGTALDGSLTFDEYHTWVEEKLASHGCQQSEYSWSGDGLIVMFEMPETAVAFGKALLTGLPAFNTCFNRLKRPLEVRIGIHSGPVLPGEGVGLARLASTTLDLAGHYQKAARPNEIVISPTTHEFVPGSMGEFAPVRRAILNAEKCFVFPPREDEPAAETVPALPETTVQPQSRGGVGSMVALGGGMVAVAFVLVGGLFWYANQPRDGKPAGAARVQVKAPAGGGTAGAGVVAGVGTATEPGAAESRPAAAAQGNAPAAQVAAVPAWSPDRRIWRSPEADSGVPVRLYPSPPDRTWILAVGAGRHQDSGLQAPGAGKDAFFVAQALQRATGTPTGNIRILSDENATLENVKRGFQWLQQNANSGKDTVLVYLGGPAWIAADRSDLRHSGGASYAFAPFDASMADAASTAVFGADITGWLGATRSQAVLLLADTPHAGAIQADLPASPDPGRQFGLLAAAGAQGVAVGRGAQASAMAEGVASGVGGAADRDGDRRVSVQELQAYLSGTLPRTAGGQTPAFAAGFGGYQPEIYFAAR